MNLRQIDFVLAVAEESSFTRAAQRCHTVQSALSHQIARLEEELGAVLFERTSRHVQLTAAGEAFVRQARLAQDAARRIPEEVAAVAGKVSGRLSIGMITSMTVIDVTELLVSFHTRHADVDISLSVSGSDSLLEDIRNRKLDVAFVGLWQGDNLKGFKYLRLSQEKLVAVLPPTHPLSGRKRLTLQELSKQSLVDFPKGSSARRQTDEAFDSAGINRHVRFEVGHMALIEKFVSRGLAVSLVPEPVAASFTGVVSIPVQNGPTRVLYAVWIATRSPATVAFIELVHETQAAGADPRKIGF